MKENIDDIRRQFEHLKLGLRRCDAQWAEAAEALKALNDTAEALAIMLKTGEHPVLIGIDWAGKPPLKLVR